jgi:hypothetical protein
MSMKRMVPRGDLRRGPLLTPKETASRALVSKDNIPGVSGDDREQGTC